MLGLMKMTIPECIAAYKQFMAVVFPTKGFIGGLWQTGSSAFTGAKWNDAPLVSVIKGLIKAKLGDPEMLLLDEVNTNSPCKV
jgi:hypothetical protein